MNFRELIQYPMNIGTFILVILIIEAIIRFSLQIRNQGKWHFDMSKALEYWAIGVFVTASFMIMFFFDNYVILFIVVFFCGLIRNFKKVQ